MSKILADYNCLKWRCGRCESWNKMESAKCKKCGMLAQQFADAFRVEDVLSATESNFYKFTAPALLHELRAIRQLLEKLVDNDQDD